MKKLLSITLCVLMVLGLAACGSNNGQQNDTSSATEQAAQETLHRLKVKNLPIRRILLKIRINHLAVKHLLFTILPLETRKP